MEYTGFIVIFITLSFFITLFAICMVKDAIEHIKEGDRLLEMIDWYWEIIWGEEE